MKLTLRDIRLPLAHFALEVDAEITRDGIGATGLFGPSGAGKTTLLDLIAGLRQAPSARIELDGRALTDTSRRLEVPARAREIGYVPQDGALFPHLSVRGNLLYGRKRGRGEERALSLERVTEVLAIGHLLDRRIGGLSGGEKQRVALARALLSAPRLLLLDEPLAALDGDLKGSILEYLRQVRDELRVPMLYVSHATEEILALCDEVLILERGRLTAQGDPRVILLRNGVSNGISSPPRYGDPGHARS